jgi:succinoglycan biosynthesis protein ExoM
MLRNTLNSLLRQETDGALSYEIIVIDDGSTDSTPTLVQEIADRSHVPIRYHREDRVGVTAARNRGLRESAGEWIAFIDDDETAEPDWLQELMTAALASDADCIGGALKLVNPEGSGATLIGTIRKYFSETTREGWFKRRFIYFGPGTCNSMVRKELFDQIGDFDPSLEVVGEDQDFFRRARKAGFKIAYTSNALVHHFIPVQRLEPNYILKTAKLSGESFAYFDWKEWGCCKTTYICVLRVAHAIFITAPNLLWAHLQGDAGNILSRKCSLTTAYAYLRKTLFLLFHGLILPARN